MLQDETSGELQYLEAFLAPLLPVLARRDVTDVFINRPGEIWVETLDGTVQRHEAHSLDEAGLWQLARQIANISHQGISREHPLLGAMLPDGTRVQIVAPPATRGAMAMAFRKHVVADIGLAEYLAAGAFARTRFHAESDEALSRLHPAGEHPEDMAAFLAEAVRGKRNILISGGTSSGKTTLLNALVREIPETERLILIEDTPEVRLRHPNAVGLLATKGDQGEARVSPDDLLQASLRMRPDRIIVGELRGGEAYTFLRAVNTGHPGSLTTIHADSPERAIEQLALIVLQSGTQLTRQDIVHYVRSVIDLVIQLDRRNGARGISRIMSTRG
ncbi:P-type DNA transfer ATPase VirB11 [Novosphingobium sediminis]|uniref:Type IV secretion system protein n=1 Tax=Novosphingobium sediminis TaxID=707214 RepID=A0A512AN73_9SPHN|nr:P-type DNA transfer ATPase VirB11 [Novosphingobium sediminis]GEO01173.1 P-type DNA transfer ATPase VirB11 [Novosphingobium sediminis]